KQRNVPAAMRHAQPASRERPRQSRCSCRERAVATAETGLAVSGMIAGVCVMAAHRCLKRVWGSACGAGNRMISATVAATLICCCGLLCGFLPCGTHLSGPAITAKMLCALFELK